MGQTVQTVDPPITSMFVLNNEEITCRLHTQVLRGRDDGGQASLWSIFPKAVVYCHVKEAKQNVSS
ncbi:hypothetical protein HanPSC8_Chr16g0714131 [Helianthus annuus]|nr:hypothetical protein HanPSC8_Chr16g0714131 [Helianthus annuus]